MLRESGKSAAEVSQAVGLSAPTVLALHRAFVAGGWDAVDRRARGRPRLPQARGAPQATLQALAGLLPENAQTGVDAPALWSLDVLARWLSVQEGVPMDKRAAQRRLAQWGWLPAPGNHAVNNIPPPLPAKKYAPVLQAGTQQAAQVVVVLHDNNVQMGSHSSNLTWVSSGR